MIWNRRKKQRPAYIENNKPKDATYKIVLGQDLKVGDIIIHNHQRCLITSVSLGGGSGSFDFGSYVPVYAQKLTGQLGFLDMDFWTFKNCPVIMEVSSKWR